MRNQIKLFSIMLAAALPFSATADTCRTMYDRIPFFKVMIWKGDDITPPYVACSYNQLNSRYGSPTYSYILTGSFVPVSGRWLSTYNQSDCFYGGEACAFIKTK